MIRIEPAKNGSPIPVRDSVALNSRYNPEKEADRFLQDALGNSTPGTIVILGETLGYLSKTVQSKLGNCRCIQVFYDDFLYHQAIHRSATAWYPGSSQSLPTFLRYTIAELQLQNLVVIDWEPSSKAFPALAAHVRNDLKSHIGIHNGSMGATARFGRRWPRNIIHNFLTLEYITGLQYEEKPLVVAAAGPTLSESFEALRAERLKYQLWALPSAVEALLSQGLRPDLIVLTDPGYYSVRHLASLSQTKVPIAMPLTAARGVSRYASALVLLNQGSCLEKLIYSNSRLPHIPIRPNGTVAGSALELAETYRAPTVFVGLDFELRGIQTHVRPHAFDPIIEDAVNRTHPSHTRRYLRAFGSRIESDSSFNPLYTYAAWFRMAASKAPMELYRLHSSSVTIPGMPDLDIAGFSDLCCRITSKGASARWEKRRIHFRTPEERKLFISDILAGLKVDLNRLISSQTAPDPHLFTASGPESLIYDLSPRELLRYMKTGERKEYEEACRNAVTFLDRLKNYADRWPC